ncbi:hypothetical protein SLU01_19830 [Sporosarcina luteola]|uniref:ATP-dependent Lon protease n=1 Tax=Sporosarcina luteola TaxID=582850 RepID=A0A511Z890_9BACL|nr:hypothetical protein [Sporosarcina luteola]GEN83671.1 hypothetical protein SLU01_19830 [Sporosarcina luteola]
MYLIISIILSVILGYLLLLFTGPLVGGLLAFGIVAGSLFRGLYLLNDIHKRLSKDEPKLDEKEAYEEHLKEKEDIDQG